MPTDTTTTTSTPAKSGTWTKIKASLKDNFIRKPGDGYINGGSRTENPAKYDEVDGNGQWRLEYQTANQGTATKWIDVSHLDNFYERARSGKAAKAVMNMFVCKPRKLREGRFFDVRVLERHPFTPQTFVPMGVGSGEDVRYLVVVAPTLPASRKRDGVKAYPTQDVRRKKSLKERLLGARPNPFTNDYVTSTTPAVSTLPSSRRPKGVGEPDLENLKAFVVRGDQAVTYGPGTWHAPMVVLGEREIEFVVVQYANGVGMEDCQEIDIVPEEDGGHGLSVEVDLSGSEASKIGYMRAKL